jgi:hypothetical protein
MMTHDEMIAVIAAHRDGKQLEYKSISDTNWKLATTPVFNFDIADYRIKPEPLVLWAVMTKENEVFASSKDKTAMDPWISDTSKQRTLKKFAEVAE